MKRIIFLVIVTCIFCSLTACYTNTTAPIPQESTQSDNTEPVRIPVPQMSMAAISLPVTTETAYSVDNKKIFDYTYQSIQLTLPDPDVADKVIIHFLDYIDMTRSIADDIKAAAEKDYKYPNNRTPYLCQILFEPMRIDQGVLSLFGNLVTYSGEPHPESTQSSHTYDLTTGERVTLRDILSENATADALANLLIDSLANRTDLYPDHEETVRHRITTNFKHDTGWYLSEDGLCFYFSPYDIAPYSAGVIHAQIPYEKLTGILNDAYFPAELEPADGILAVSKLDKQSIGQFTQICEVSVGKGSEGCLLFTDRAVYNLRICLPDNRQGQDSHTEFLAHALTPGDAVIIQGFDPNNQSNILVTYESNNAYITSQLQFNSANQSYTLKPRA